MWTSLWTSPKERMRLESIQFLPSKKKKKKKSISHDFRNKSWNFICLQIIILTRENLAFLIIIIVYYLVSYLILYFNSDQNSFTTLKDV